jgi:hypothetical protein
MLSPDESAKLRQFFDDNTWLLSHSPPSIKGKWWGKLREMGVQDGTPLRWTFRFHEIDVSCARIIPCEHVRVTVTGEDWRGRPEWCDVSAEDGPWWDAIAEWLSGADAVHELRRQAEAASS